MAEAPPNGLFWFAADEAARRTEFDGDRVIIDVAPHGPAGASSVDLPGGELLQVDHLDPTRLVGVESVLVDPGGSPLLVALFGGDDALRITDRERAAGPPDDGDDPAADDLLSPRRTGGRAVPLDQDAQRAGRLVVLADLATDDAAEPLARVVAAAEFIGGLEVTPGGDLFVPAVPHLVERAVAAARQVDDDMLATLDQKLAYQLTAALRPLVAAAPTGTVRSFLFRLVERIGELAGTGDVMVALMAPLAEEPFADEYWEDEMGSPSVADGARDRVSAPTIRIVRHSPSLVEVTAPRSDRPRWVRALRTDGLVAVALAPLHRDGLMESAELVVPPDTDTDDLELQLVPADDLHQLAGAPVDLVRRAVRSGRAAASAERRGDQFEAMQRWRRCSELWDRVGDKRRGRQAAERRTSLRGRVMVGPILADELDPYGVDAQIDSGDRW